MGKVSALEQQRVRDPKVNLCILSGSSDSVKVFPQTDNVCFCGCVQHVDQMLRDLTEENKPAYEKLKVKKALDTVTVDKDRLAQSLQQAVLTNSKVQQNQATITLRDEELHEARTKANDLSEELSAIKRRFSEDYEFAMKKLHREISELKMTVKDSSRSSGDLSKGLHRRVSELERLASTQRVRIREQRSQRRQEQQSRELHQDNCQKVEVSGKREVEWERWTSTIQRWEAKRQLAHVTEGLNPVRTQLETHRTHR
ncbi:putative coiled-coil domain-containing protein 150-like [Scophthalmus maximus]|uniref:Putative coiled-coil domain-containing protein 150-like n=1 Tax=Scophthalmus maximus TaxID=52904 RepID=A0A2U9B3I8_SCOMX|nr:putative coiled-coil domain-containing protein 150-like [Scophthalmus maximus]